MKTIIKGGTVITAADTFAADLLLEGGRITQMGANLPAAGARVVDAGGMLLLPGGIDVHTHLELPFFGTVAADDFYTGQRAAAFGGTTSHIDFAIQYKGESLHQALENWQHKARDKAVIDYGLHVAITDLNDTVMAEIPSLASAGVTTIKLFQAYKGVYQVDDATLFRAMLKAAEAGMLVMVHSENGDVIDFMIRNNVAHGNLATEYHARSHPAWAEAEASLRAIALAGIAGAPLYIVHMTCAESVDQLRYGRARGLQVMGETCPQYLFFTTDNLRQPDGAKYVCSPPVRTAADNEYLWQALSAGHLQVVATDHCPFLFDGTQAITYEGESYRKPGKELGASDFSKIPNGMHGIEDRQLLLWTYGVNTGRISANRFVEVTATNPAKIFGMYPRKGTLAPGSDADVVVWDPAAELTVDWRQMHMRVDHNVYDGRRLRGRPRQVFVRGELLVDGSAWHGRRGSGAFLRRSSHAPVI